MSKKGKGGLTHNASGLSPTPRQNARKQPPTHKRPTILARRDTEKIAPT